MHRYLIDGWMEATSWLGARIYSHIYCTWNAIYVCTYLWIYENVHIVYTYMLVYIMLIIWPVSNTYLQQTATDHYTSFFIIFFFITLYNGLKKFFTGSQLTSNNGWGRKNNVSTHLLKWISTTSTWLIFILCRY